jgi:farnesyl diphosphate synthase
VPRGRCDHGASQRGGPHQPARLCARSRPRFPDRDDLLDAQGEEAKTGKRVGKDADAGKETFVSLLGADRARQQAQMLVEQAIDHLHAFGEEAELLRDIARFAVTRDH